MICRISNAVPSYAPRLAAPRNSSATRCIACGAMQYAPSSRTATRSRASSLSFGRTVPPGMPDASATSVGVAVDPSRKPSSSAARRARSVHATRWRADSRSNAGWGRSCPEDVSLTKGSSAPANSARASSRSSTTSPASGSAFSPISSGALLASHAEWRAEDQTTPRRWECQTRYIEHIFGTKTTTSYAMLERDPGMPDAAGTSFGIAVDPSRTRVPRLYERLTSSGQLLPQPAFDRLSAAPASRVHASRASRKFPAPVQFGARQLTFVYDKPSHRICILAHLVWCPPRLPRRVAGRGPHYPSSSRVPNALAGRTEMI
jgi:hypothetical protein